jgi:hypothetical protein
MGNLNQSPRARPGQPLQSLNNSTIQRPYTSAWNTSRRKSLVQTHPTLSGVILRTGGTTSCVQPHFFVIPLLFRLFDFFGLFACSPPPPTLIPSSLLIPRTTPLQTASVSFLCFKFSLLSENPPLPHRLARIMTAAVQRCLPNFVLFFFFLFNFNLCAFFKPLAAAARA